MQSFTYHNHTKLVFGEGALASTGALAKEYGATHVLVCAYGDKATAPMVEAACRSLREAGMTYALLTGIKPNPSLECIDAGIEQVRRDHINFLLAVGGGSVIDTAKAIATGVAFEGRKFWDLVGHDEEITTMMPMGAVVTIPAAGSESSLGLCVTNPDIHAKCTISAPVMRPQFAILDPTLTYGLPAYQTFCGIADILSHLMERYFTADPHNDLTDRMLEGAMASVIHNGRILRQNLGDKAARAEIMFAATVAQNDLLGAGRDADWACHYVAALISGAYDTTHGAALALVTPWWMAYVLESAPQRFAQFAVRVMGAAYDFERPLVTAHEGIRRLRAFFDELGLPAHLSDLPDPHAATDAGIQEMADCYTRDFGSIGSIRRIYTAEAKAILELAK